MLSQNVHHLLRSMKKKVDIKKRFVAHRGANNSAPGNTYPHLPENTIHSLREAYNKGAYFVECDIHMSKDGEIVVIHDDTLARTARYNPDLAITLTEEEFNKMKDTELPHLDYQKVISQVDVGAYADYLDKSYRGTRISLLQDFLKELKDHPQRTLVIELKAGDTRIVDTLKKLIDDCVLEYRLELHQLIFISFDFQLISLCKSALPSYQHLLLTTATPHENDRRPDPKNPAQEIGLYYRIDNKKDLERVIKLTKSAKLDGLDVEYNDKLIDADFMQRIHSAGLKSIVWNYAKDDTLTMCKSMLDAGADLINTNQPERVFNELSVAMGDTAIVYLKSKF